MDVERMRSETEEEREEQRARWAARTAAAKRPLRVGNVTAALDKLKADDIYVTLKLDEVDGADVSEIIRQYAEKLEAARAADDPGKALDDFWRTILTHIAHRAGQVFEAARSRRQT
jgi:hypothetical protein